MSFTEVAVIILLGALAFFLVRLICRELSTNDEDDE